MTLCNFYVRWIVTPLQINSLPVIIRIGNSYAKSIVYDNLSEWVLINTKYRNHHKCKLEVLWAIAVMYVVYPNQLNGY